MERVLLMGVVLEPEEVWEEEVVAEAGWEAPDLVQVQPENVYALPVELLPLIKQVYLAIR